MNKKVFFQQENISVTERALTVNNQTYDMHAIHAARLQVIKPKRELAILWIFVGLLLLLEEGALFAIGGLSVIVGVLTWVTKTQQYAVIIQTQAAEHEVFTSSDRVTAEKVIHALDAARVRRFDPRPQAQQPLVAQPIASDEDLPTLTPSA